MFQILTAVIAISVCVLSIWAPRSAWIAFGVVDTFFLFQLVAVRKLYRIGHLVSVSAEAKPLAEKYGHYFMLPFAARDYSASSATLQFAGVALAAFTWFTGFKWGVLCALVNWLLMGYVAHSFSPVAVLAKYPELRSAHDDIFETLAALKLAAREKNKT